MVDVLLINPQPDDHPLGRREVSEPLGLEYLAASLERRGFSAEVLDLCITNWNLSKIVEVAKEKTPFVVGISVYTAGLRQAYGIVAGLREGGLSSSIIAGGPHVTADPHIVSDMKADYGIRGDGEHILVEFCEAAGRGKLALNGVEGIVRQLGSRFEAGRRHVIMDLDALPFPKRTEKLRREYSHVGISASRGCPYNCSFCFKSRGGYRRRSPESVTEEIRSLSEEYGVKRLDIVDDVFGLEERQVIGFCNGLRERELDIAWNCTTRVDCMNEPLLETMYNSGLEWISVGVESGDERLRRENGKDIEDSRYTKFFRECRRIGIKTRAFFILGLPGENAETLKKTQNFAVGLEPDEVQYSLLEVAPETDVYYKFLSHENKNKTLWRGYMLGKIKYPIYIPRGFTRDTFYRALEGVFGGLPFSADVL